MRIDLQIELDTTKSVQDTFAAVHDIFKNTADYQRDNVLTNLSFEPENITVKVYWNDCTDRARTLKALKELSNYILTHGL